MASAFDVELLRQAGRDPPSLPRHTMARYVSRYVARFRPVCKKPPPPHFCSTRGNPSSMPLHSKRATKTPPNIATAQARSNRREVEVEGGSQRREELSNSLGGGFWQGKRCRNSWGQQQREGAGEGGADSVWLGGEGGRRMFIRSLAGTERKTRGAGLMRALLACCLAGMAMGLTGEAPWGNAWSDSAGVLATSFAPLSIFYTCSVRDLTYSTLAACNAACEMGKSPPAQPPASTIRLETGSSRHGPVLACPSSTDRRPCACRAVLHARGDAHRTVDHAPSHGGWHVGLQDDAWNHDWPKARDDCPGVFSHPPHLLP